MLLALDTATSAITVAVHDGARVLAARSTIDARAHGELLAPSIEAVLSDAGVSMAELTEIVVGTGPGPFTGLRVGVVTARVIAFARGLPAHGLCSLDALAHAGAAELGVSELVVATDARRKEVYWARYVVDPATGLVERQGEPQVAKAAEIADQVQGLPVVGRGPLLYPVLGESTGLLDVDAGALAELAVRRAAAGIEPEDTEPRYLRRPDALTLAERAAAG